MDHQQKQYQTLNQDQNLNLNMQQVLDELIQKTQQFAPPENSPEEIKELYQFLLQNKQQGVDDLKKQLENFHENKLQEIVQNIEKLYLQLMIEYDQEIKRGHKLGILNQEEQKNQ